ncbi:hypothetical protein E2562_007411 [Oryza meyeriana var. granulata]|uniref:Uncharacterized protein n=1 Tax=Oryza meyeriana var. granulata TaxID=110450 RepID=A0A6G1CYV5_9ORYZ|nr:hypothetical protein E2562_007411 [Oryza meyeriana var. granulata]
MAGDGGGGSHGGAFPLARGDGIGRPRAPSSAGLESSFSSPSSASSPPSSMSFSLSHRDTIIGASSLFLPSSASSLFIPYLLSPPGDKISNPARPRRRAGRWMRSPRDAVGRPTWSRSLGSSPSLRPCPFAIPSSSPSASPPPLSPATSYQPSPWTRSSTTPGCWARKQATLMDGGAASVGVGEKRNGTAGGYEEELEVLRCSPG